MNREAQSCGDMEKESSRSRQRTWFSHPICAAPYRPPCCCEVPIARQRLLLGLQGEKAPYLIEDVEVPLQGVVVHDPGLLEEVVGGVKAHDLHLPVEVQLPGLWAEGERVSIVQML